MSKTAKSVNYSEVQEQEMAFVYGDSQTDAERANDVSNLANKFGKSVQSIRAKLSKMKVYVKPEKVAKDGKPVTRKVDLVADLASKMGVDVQVVESLEKATKTSLEILVAQINFLEDGFSEN